MEKLKPYPKYKPVNLPWLKEIPAHWECKKIRAYFSERRKKVSDQDFAPLSVTKQGVVPQLETACKTNDGDNRKLALSGDFVINSRSGRKGSSGISYIDGSVSLINIVLEPRNIHGPYINYLLRSNDFIEEFYRNGRGLVADLWTTRYQEMRNIFIPIPQLDEQKKIVAFLDEKTAKIDKYIETKSKEIELLKEQKNAEISNAVTRGLNPNVKYKAIDLLWLKEIPAHWEPRSLSNLASEYFVSNKNMQEQNLLSLSYGRIIRKNINTTEGLLPASYDTYQIVEKGNIIIRPTDLQNDHRSLRVGLANERGIITSAYIALKCTKEVIPEYLYLLLHTYDLHKIFYGMGGGMRQSLKWQEFRKLNFYIPPKEEQKKIVAYLDERIAKIDKVISAIQQKIDLIKEYKSSLISDVVTGKIKV